MRLLIIGNGFDKQCGLKSGFTNYYDYLLKEKTYKTILNVTKPENWVSLKYTMKALRNLQKTTKRKFLFGILFFYTFKKTMSYIGLMLRK